VRILACGVNVWRVVEACGGTLTRYVDDGHEVALATLQDSRSDEAVASGKRAASELGINYDPRPAVADGIADTRAARDALMDAIRRAAPEVILGPSPLSRLPGDVEAARLTFNAAYGACVPNYPSPEGVAAAGVRAAIVHMDFGALPRPTDYVDIGEAWARKSAALAQVAALTDEPEACSAAARAEIVGRARGVQVQLEFVEAFDTERVWGRLRARRLLP
jgi:LmbE family N-acetylglucosaminyl deacetylase